MNREELQQWLGERESRSRVALDEIADVLHVVVDATRRAVSFANGYELNELRFAIAVLRDVFARDVQVRDWLTTPVADRDGTTPADLLAANQIREFADLAVAEWNRPRTTRALRPHASLVQAFGTR